MLFYLSHSAYAQSSSQNTIQVDQGTLAFPPLPKISIDKDGGVSINNVVKTQARSAANLKGVWVAAKIMMDAQKYNELNLITYDWGQGACPNQTRERVYSGNSWNEFWCEVFGTCAYRWRTPIHMYNYTGTNSTFYLAPKKVDAQQSTKDNTFFIWVPLKNTNNLYYTVTSQYEIAKTYQLNYGDSFTQSSMVKTGFTTSNTTVKSVSHDQTSMNEYGFGQELSAQIETSAGVKLEGIIDMSAKTTIGTKATASQKFGFSFTDKYSTSFQESYSSSKETTESFTIQRKGPNTPGFVKAYVDLYPTSDYAFTGSEDGQPVDIAQYIDYDGKQFTSLANFLEYIFEPNQFYKIRPGVTNPRCTTDGLGNLGYQPQNQEAQNGNLYKYLHKYTDVISMNDGISTDLYDALSSTFGNSYIPTKTRIWTCSIEQPSVHLNYQARTLSVEQPTDCSALTKAPTQQLNADRSVLYTWDAPVSATKFKVEIKKKGDSWTTGMVYTFLVDREYDSATHNPLEPSLTDAKTPYDVVSTYVVRVTPQCGINGSWLDPSPETQFTLYRPNCIVDKPTIRAIRDIDNEYNITWDPVIGAQGYYIEYAIDEEDFGEARKRLSVTGFGAVHPFDLMQTTTTYPLRADSYFKVKVTPQCSGTKGTAVVQYFNMDGTIRTSDQHIDSAAGDLIIFPNPAAEGTEVKFVVKNLKQRIKSPQVSVYNVSRGTRLKLELDAIGVNQEVPIGKPLEPGYYILNVILPDTDQKLTGRFIVTK